jgi:regulator of cell morphogenesis and NO signaling
METRTTNIIDATLLHPTIKHPTIFQAIDKLTDGDDLILYNDHDPKPLRYQIINERGEGYGWEYIEQGPDRWIVKISKNNVDESVGHIVASDWRKASVLKKYGIDFCCGGKKSLRNACEEKGADYPTVKEELLKVVRATNDRSAPFNDWSPSFLVDYIVNTHHAYVVKTLPDIQSLAGKVEAVHGGEHPEVREVRAMVEMLADELLQHMHKEEAVLFPVIRELTAGSTRPTSFGPLGNPITVMEHEHDSAGEILRQIRKVTNDYMIPHNACNSFSILYKMLEEFEADLHQHIHLENNILFPKAIELERTKLSEISS